MGPKQALKVSGGGRDRGVRHRCVRCLPARAQLREAQAEERAAGRRFC